MLDEGKNSVVVKLADQNINIVPGHNLSIADNNYSNGQFGNINPLEKIGYRNLSRKIIADKVVYIGEFSILSTIYAIKPLKAMIKSNDKTISKLAGRLLKTAGVIMQTQNYKGLYQQVQKTDLTAMR